MPFKEYIGVIEKVFIRTWKRTVLSKKYRNILTGNEDDGSEDEETVEENGFEEFEGGYKVPLKIWNKLFRYTPK